MTSTLRVSCSCVTGYRITVVLNYILKMCVLCFVFSVSILCQLLFRYCISFVQLNKSIVSGVRSCCCLVELCGMVQGVQ